MARRKRKKMTKHVPTACRFAVAVELGADGELPTEIRLFKAGWNHSEHRSVLFDAEAAAATMAAYKAHGVDRMIDLEHLSTDTEAPNFDPDARGWCRLELRSGELWAVDVKWTDDGAERLTSRKQRYVSPWFGVDKQRRVRKVMNIALTAMPATHEAFELVAARTTETWSMNPEMIKKALEAITAGDADAAMEILKGLIAEAAGDAPADEAPEALADDAPPEDDEALADGAPEDEPEDEEQAAVVAATARLTRITGKRTIGAAVEEVEAWKASHLSLATEREALRKEQAALEADERDRLTVALVQAGEQVATAWAVPLHATDRKLRKPAEPWASMPIASLRSRVKSVGGSPATVKMRAPASGGPAGLTAQQLKICKETGCDPSDFAAIQAQRVS